MAYTALPDMRMPYDNDGTVVAYGPQSMTGSSAVAFAQGVSSYLTGADLILLNGSSWAVLAANPYVASSYNNVQMRPFWWFFPEQREVTGIVFGSPDPNATFSTTRGIYVVQGSNDTTNGADGTWETASLGSTTPDVARSVDGWRAHIYSVSLTGPKRVIRLALASDSNLSVTPVLLHLYGRKAAGQTPDDILFLDGLNSYAEFAAPEDFGDVPLATTTVRTFKVKNGSATHTANSINLQCNDADFAISTDNVTWVATINIASLAAGASSGVMYVRNTSPAIGSPLGPRFARIVATVASYT
jgi:hypothetical protein